MHVPPRIVPIQPTRSLEVIGHHPGYQDVTRGVGSTPFSSNSPALSIDILCVLHKITVLTCPTSSAVVLRRVELALALTQTLTQIRRPLSHLWVLGQPVVGAIFEQPSDTSSLRKSSTGPYRFQIASRTELNRTECAMFKHSHANQIVKLL